MKGTQSRIFCTFCGNAVEPGYLFCRYCGRPVTPKKKTRNKKAAAIAIILSSILVFGIVLAGIWIALTHRVLPGSSNMALGAERHIVTQTIKPSGGKLEIDETGTELDGMVLMVPDGAYDSSTRFEIGMSEIKSYNLGELFHPATPLIHIENGGGFANQPMTVEIPIEKSSDEFAMAFYYDTETGEMEGIPTLELKNDHITIVTCHFCDLVVTKEKPERILGTELDKDFAIDSGFRPGSDDFRCTNHGSVMCPKGHCAGQCIGAMYYYLNHSRLGWDEDLYWMFDDNGRGDTPFFEWDDASAMRLCSVLQLDYETKWPSVTKFSGNTYLECAYAIQETHQPQLIEIRRAGGAHAVIVYKVATNGIWIADPNYPGEEREIMYANGAFSSYFSGSNYEEASTNSKEYKVTGYYGLFSLINKADVQAAWGTLRSGQDPGAGLFPADLNFSVSVGKDPDTGFFINVPLTDGMAITNAQIAEAGQSGLLVSTAIGPGDEVYFFSGETPLQTCDYAQSEFPCYVYPLQQGKNDIGILYVSKKEGSYEFVNFYRFTVYLQDEVTMSVSPESATVFVGDPIPFTVTATGAPPDAFYLWDFGDGTYDETNEPSYSYIYDAEGTYDGMVMLYSAADLDTPLAECYFYVCVLVDEETASPPETSSPVTSQTLSEALIGEWYSEDSGVTLIFNSNGTGSAYGPYGSSSITYTISGTEIYVTGTNVDTYETETIIMYISEYEGYLVLVADGEVFYKTG